MKQATISTVQDTYQGVNTKPWGVQDVRMASHFVSQAMTSLSYLDVRNIKTWKTTRKENRQGGTIFSQSLPLIDYSTVRVKITNYKETLEMPLVSRKKQSCLGDAGDVSDGTKKTCQDGMYSCSRQLTSEFNLHISMFIKVSKVTLRGIVLPGVMRYGNTKPQKPVTVCQLNWSLTPAHYVYT